MRIERVILDYELKREYQTWLQAQGRLGTLSSRVMLGILIVQDLAVVPLMIVLPALSDPAGGLLRVGTAAVRAVLLLGAIVLFSTRVVPRLMAFVARWNSRELFFLSTITLAVGVGYVAYSFGLSMALGAFVAGLIVSESEYSHQALSDVVPLRDLFGMLFFVSVGMLLNPALVWDQLGALVLIVGAIIVGKATILAGIVRAFGYWNVVPLAVGLTLFQVGEFAFVLARVGLSSGAISSDVYTLTLNAAIITMALTPAVSNLVPVVYGRFWPRRAQEMHEATNLPLAGALAGSGDAPRPPSRPRHGPPTRRVQLLGPFGLLISVLQTARNALGKRWPATAVRRRIAGALIRRLCSRATCRPGAPQRWIISRLFHRTFEKPRISKSLSRMMVELCSPNLIALRE